ncbi:unnamed protein product, partial [Discosporangium mesarthrocarpum]
MGLGKRLLTAAVALPLAFWAIHSGALLFAAVALILQAVCIHELGLLVMSTGPACTITADGGRASSPLLMHFVAAGVCLAATWGREMAGLATMTGMAILIARRLTLMHDHQTALLACRDDVGGVDGKDVKGRMADAHMAVLSLEVAFMLYIIGGWSSLVVLRCSGRHGAGNVIFLLAVVFNADNGGLFVGSMSKRVKQAISGATTTPSFPNVLTLASPNKTWAGVAGAMTLGTLTAVAWSEGWGWAGYDGFSASSLPLQARAAVGMALSVMGVVGDLGESMLKRAAK